MADRTYVLVTPARNEQATVEATLKSVVAQTILPREWVIVSDRSTDGMEGIIKDYAARHPFIRLVRIEGGAPEHSFAAVVRATETGVKALQTAQYSYLGLLDADVRFAPDYYEKLIGEFEKDANLGLGGGMVLDVGDKTKRAHQNLNEIAGATQFFSRPCFESLGGLMAIPEGGWDAITCVRARMNGYRTATFPNIVMDHLKPRNIAKGNWFQRYSQLGQRDYVLGMHPLFLMAKCASRLLEPPVILAAMARGWGFAQAFLRGSAPYPPAEILAFQRKEQLHRLGSILGCKKNSAAN